MGVRAVPRGLLLLLVMLVQASDFAEGLPTVNIDDYDRIASDLLKRAHEIETEKRPAYTLGDEDVLKNFRSVGARLKLTPEQTWGVLFLKHVDACTAIMLYPDMPVAESPLERFADTINYLKLGFALLAERDAPQ